MQGAGQMAAHDDKGGMDSIGNALDRLLETTHFTVVDLPGAKKSAGSKFHLIPRRHAKASEIADRGGLANTLRNAASVATAAACSVVGGIAGLVTGSALGTVEGVSSGLGLRSALESWADGKFGAGALGGTTPIRKASQKVYDKTQQLLGLESVSNVVGGAAGLVIGLVGGALGGLAHGAKMAWDMGKILGRNVAEEHLANHFESKGMVEVAPAQHPPHSHDAHEPHEAHETHAHPEGHEAHAHHEGHEAHEHRATDESKTPAQRAEQLWSLLADVPEVLRNTARPEGAPAWQFAVFADGTPKDLESQEIRQVMEFERNLPVGTSARIHLRRSGLLPGKLKKLLPWAKLAASGVSLALTAGVSGIALAPLLLTRLVSLGVSASAVKELTLDRLTEKESDWTGQRVYSLANNKVDAPMEHIETKPQSHHPAVDPVGSSQLARDLQSSFSGSGPRVAVFSGHGESYEKIAGYKPAVLGEALTEAYKQTGQKTDLVVLEGCFTGTLEALQPLAEGARYALVSQLPVHKVGLPWHHILKNLDDLGQEPRELGANLVELVGGQASVPSLSLIDLQEVGNLSAELEKLAKSLPADVLAEALPAGDLIASRDEPIGKRLLRKLRQWGPGSHSGDLDKILQQIGARVDTPELRQQVDAVRASLGKVVVSAKGSGLGGLSVETNAPLFDRQHYQESTGMESWGDGLAATQPAVFKPVARLASQATQTVEKVTSYLSRAWYGQPLGTDQAISPT